MLEHEEHEQRWRILWVAAMALVRSVGHVLRNVDREDPRARPLIDAAWERWNAEKSANKVFWEFIENERNNILKEYQFSVLDSAVVGLVVVGGSEEPGHALAYETLPDNLFRPIEQGYGTGEDARDIYRDALQWWDAELSRIEAGLAASKS